MEPQPLNSFSNISLTIPSSSNNPNHQDQPPQKEPKTSISSLINTLPDYLIENYIFPYLNSCELFYIARGVSAEWHEMMKNAWGTNIKDEMFNQIKNLSIIYEKDTLTKNYEFKLNYLLNYRNLLLIYNTNANILMVLNNILTYIDNEQIFNLLNIFFKVLNMDYCISVLNDQNNSSKKEIISLFLSNNETVDEYKKIVNTILDTENINFDNQFYVNVQNEMSNLNKEYIETLSEDCTLIYSFLQGLIEYQLLKVNVYELKRKVDYLFLKIKKETELWPKRKKFFETSYKFLLFSKSSNKNIMKMIKLFENYKLKSPMNDYKNEAYKLLLDLKGKMEIKKKRILELREKNLDINNHQINNNNIGHCMYCNSIINTSTTSNNIANNNNNNNEINTNNTISIINTNQDQIPIINTNQNEIIPNNQIDSNAIVTTLQNTISSNINASINNHPDSIQTSIQSVLSQENEESIDEMFLQNLLDRRLKLSQKLILLEKCYYIYINSLPQNQTLNPQICIIKSQKIPIKTFLLSLSYATQHFVDKFDEDVILKVSKMIDKKQIDVSNFYITDEEIKKEIEINNLKEQKKILLLQKKQTEQVLFILKKYLMLKQNLNNNKKKFKLVLYLLVKFRKGEANVLDQNSILEVLNNINLDDINFDDGAISENERNELENFESSDKLLKEIEESLTKQINNFINNEEDISNNINNNINNIAIDNIVKDNNIINNNIHEDNNIVEGYNKTNQITKEGNVDIEGCNMMEENNENNKGDYEDDNFNNKINENNFNKNDNCNDNNNDDNDNVFDGFRFLPDKKYKSDGDQD